MSPATVSVNTDNIKHYRPNIRVSTGDASSGTARIEKNMSNTPALDLPGVIIYKKEEAPQSSIEANPAEGKPIASLECELLKVIDDLAYLRVYSHDKFFEVAIDTKTLIESNLNYNNAHFQMIISEDPSGLVRTKYEVITQKNIWHKMAQEINVDALFE